jgi:hypothetical protein
VECKETPFLGECVCCERVIARRVKPEENLLKADSHEKEQLHKNTTRVTELTQRKLHCTPVRGRATNAQRVTEQPPAHNLRGVSQRQDGVFDGRTYQFLSNLRGNDDGGREERRNTHPNQPARAQDSEDPEKVEIGFGGDVGVEKRRQQRSNYSSGEMARKKQ